jgi:hypothetical protein
VPRVVLGEFGNAPEQKRLEELAFAREPKKKFLEYTREKAAENPCFTWSALATGNFFLIMDVYPPGGSNGLTAVI